MGKVLVYGQSSGRLSLADQGGEGSSSSLGRGYSGASPYVNSPDAEALVARGPIPRGSYKLVGPFDHVRLGPVVWYLAPEKSNNMHGRSGFFIHGDNEFGNQTASRGCIILARSIRDKIRDSGATLLQVL